MRIYLVRHGKAAKTGYPNDADRPLTARGQEDVQNVAAQLARAGVEIYQIRHSGLVRAQQTAEILGKALNPPGGVISVAGLTYADPVEPLATELHFEPEPVMFVGHNPFMEQLVGLLLTGDRGKTPVWFATSTTVCLNHIDHAWSVRWVLDRKITQDDSNDM